MSIWCTGERIGYEPRGLAVDGEAPPKMKSLRNGQVRSYATGFSNHYPTTTGDYEQPAAVALATIAPWCVPGHDEPCTCKAGAHDWPEVGPWLRLELLSHEHIWEEGGKPSGRIEGADVVLDEAAVTTLRDRLTEWLDQPKVQPRQGA